MPHSSSQATNSKNTQNSTNSKNAIEATLLTGVLEEVLTGNKTRQSIADNKIAKENQLVQENEAARQRAQAQAQIGTQGKTSYSAALVNQDRHGNPIPPKPLVAQETPKRVMSKEEEWYPVTYAQKQKEKEEAEWVANNPNATAAELFYPSMRKKPVVIPPESQAEILPAVQPVRAAEIPPVVQPIPQATLKPASKPTQKKDGWFTNVAMASEVEQGKEANRQAINKTLSDEFHREENEIMAFQQIQEQQRKVSQEKKQGEGIKPPNKYNNEAGTIRSAESFTWEGAQITANGEGFYLVASTPLDFGGGGLAKGIYDIPDMELPEISAQAMAEGGGDPLMALRIVQGVLKDKPQHQPEHLLLMGPNGKNIGYDATGFVNNIRLDRMLKIENEGIKYKAKFMDQAAKILAEEDAMKKQKYEDSEKKLQDYLLKGDTGDDAPFFKTKANPEGYERGEPYKTYGLSDKNCQHYVHNVIALAQKLADEAEESLTIE